jgi:hypothetical protein
VVSTLASGTFGGLVVSILASGTQDCGFKPGQKGQIFQREKVLSMPSFGGEVKPSVPCRRFAACKRSCQMAWNSPFIGKITRHFSPTVPPFPARGPSHRRRRGTWWWKQELPKPGSYNKHTWLQYCWGHQPPGPNRRRRRIRRRSIIMIQAHIHGEEYFLSSSHSLSLVKKFPHSLWYQKFHYHVHKSQSLFLSRARSIQSVLSILIHEDPFLILSIHLRQRITTVVILSRFFTKMLYAPVLSPLHATYPTHLILLYFISRIVFYV